MIVINGANIIDIIKGKQPISIGVSRIDSIIIYPNRILIVNINTVARIRVFVELI